MNKQQFTIGPKNLNLSDSQQIEDRILQNSAFSRNQQTYQEASQQNVKESTSQTWHQPSQQDRENLCQNQKFEIFGEQIINMGPNIQRNSNQEEGQNLNINNQEVCHKNYNQIIKSDQEYIMQNQAPQVNPPKKQIQPQESQTGQCQQPLKDCQDDLQDRIENQGSTEKSDNLSGGKQSGISSTKAQTTKFGISQNIIQREGMSNSFGIHQNKQQWKNKQYQQSNLGLINKHPHQQSTSQQPYISTQRRKDRQQNFGLSNNKGSQDSRVAPSVAPSFTPSVAPSCGPSSTNPLLSDIIRLDDDEECWLKGQLMGNTAPVAPIQDQVMKDIAIIPDQQMPIPLPDHINETLLQDFGGLQVQPEVLAITEKISDEHQDDVPSENKERRSLEKKSEMPSAQNEEEEDVLKLEISNRHNDEESSSSMQINSIHHSNKKSQNSNSLNLNPHVIGNSQADPILIDRDDDEDVINDKKSEVHRKELSVSQEKENVDDDKNKDDTGSVKESSHQQNTQQDQTEYMRLYQIQMEKAQQEKIAQYRREAEEAAQAKFNEELASKQKQNESFLTLSQPINVKDLYLDDQQDRQTQEIQKMQQSLLVGSNKHSDVDM